MTTSRVLPLENVRKLESLSDVPSISYLVPPESLRFDMGISCVLMYRQLPVHSSPAILEMTGNTFEGSVMDGGASSFSVD